MSHYMTALAMKQKGLKPAAKIVLYWLADHHNGETGMCFPSLKTLANECEMDVATVKRHLISLENCGLIERNRRQRENGSQTSTQYILCLTEPLAQNAPPPSAKCATPLAQKHTPHNLGNNNLGREPLDNNDHFEDFWAAYPRKVGKGNARKAFAKALKNSSVEEIASGLNRQIEALSSKEQQFIPHAATWLNGERWNDEPDTNSNGNTSNARNTRSGRGHNALMAGFASYAAGFED